MYVLVDFELDMETLGEGDLKFTNNVNVFVVLYSGLCYYVYAVTWFARALNSP